MENLQIDGLINGRAPEPGFVCGGQPTPEQLKAAVNAGLRRVINLRPPSEDAGYDEAAVARELGLDYTVLAIASGDDLNRDNAAKMDTLINAAGQPTLVHCASGNRVGALMALRAAWLQGKSSAEALAQGRNWGLKGMEPAVRQLLG